MWYRGEDAVGGIREDERFDRRPRNLGDVAKEVIHIEEQKRKSEDEATRSHSDCSTHVMLLTTHP